MEVERAGSGNRPIVRHVSRVGYVKKVIGKRKYGRTKRHMKKPFEMAPPEVPMALQELFLSCREVFQGPGTIPLPHDVNKLCLILGMLLCFQMN